MPSSRLGKPINTNHPRDKSFNHHSGVVTTLVVNAEVMNLATPNELGNHQIQSDGIANTSHWLPLPTRPPSIPSIQLAIIARWLPITRRVINAAQSASHNRRRFPHPAWQLRHDCGAIGLLKVPSWWGSAG